MAKYKFIQNYTPHIAIYLIFLILSVAVMFPVVINMSKVMYGLPGDPNFRIWQSWYFKYAFLHNKPFYFSDFIGAPFGANLRFIPSHLFWDKLLFVTTLLSNEIFSYNLFIFLSFFLSGVTMYYLVHHITNDRFISLFSGIIYMFCPYHLAHSVGHLTLASIQWLPLFILGALKFSRNCNLKNAVFLGLSLALVFISSYYYGVFSYVVLFLFLLFFVVINKIKITKRFILYLGISLFISIIIISIFVIPLYKNTIGASSEIPQLSSAYTSPTKYLFSGSARPLSYLLPSYMHPVFGNFTKLFIGSPFYGDSKGENSLYLGIFPLILSWIAIKYKTKTSRTFLCLFIASIILSMPPYIRFFGLIIPLPQFFIFKALPMFRTFSRFGIYAMLCISVLAGLGLKEWTSEISSSKRKNCIYALSVIVIFLEFLVNPLKYKTDLSNPPEVYKWLALQKGDFIICEYPLSKSSDMRTDWLLWQRTHKKRKVEAAFPGVYVEKFKEHILKLQDKDTPRILSWLGVKYVIVHLEDMRKSEVLDIVGILPDFGKHPGLKLAKRFEGVDVYEVIAKPLKPDF